MPSEPSDLTLPFGGDATYRRAVREKYNNIEIWPATDRWLAHVREFISGALRAWQPLLGLTPQSRVLNAGSGDESYNLRPGFLVDCDIADRKLVGLPAGVAGDVTRLPFRDGSIDVCVCVGSVVNYVDAARAIAEIGRVLKPDGRLVLEFECSASLEYFLTPHFRKEATQVSTFYIYENENIWIYAEAYIRDLLARQGLHVLELRRTHVVAPFFYRWRKDLNWAAGFAGLDRYVSWLPWLNRHAANVMVLCERRG